MDIACAALLLLGMMQYSPIVKSKTTHDLSECGTSEDCPTNKVCLKQICIDPCEDDICGENTLCHVTDHIPKCACDADYNGHPFSGCFPAPTDLPHCNNTAAGSSTSKGSKEKIFHLHHTTKMNWYQAMAHCNSKGMKLATIKNEEEHNKLVGMIHKADVKEQWSWWIGGSDLGQSGNYIWLSTGEPLTYLRFFQHQPDNHIYKNGEKEHCMELKHDWNYFWNDYICEQHNYFACEEQR